MRRIAILMAATAMLAMTLSTAALANDCIFAGKGYTEGAVLEGLTCTCPFGLDKCNWDKTITAPPQTEPPEVS